MLDAVFTFSSYSQQNHLFVQQCLLNIISLKVSPYRIFPGRYSQNAEL